MITSTWPIRHIDVAGTGFTVLDRVYANGSLADESLGGSCGNVLVSLAMLEHQVVPILTLGDDNEGERLIAEFVQAGAQTRYIHRRFGLRSPVLAQELDTVAGQHAFSFVCPESKAYFPRFEPIGDPEVDSAQAIVSDCSIFYTDRLSESILRAMRKAWSAGAIVLFEPSEIAQESLFFRALEVVTVLKYSADRLGEKLAGLSAECVRIVTHGAAGLEIMDLQQRFWRDAVSARIVIDTCGSGDMVTVGMIDRLIAKGVCRERVTAASLVEGVVAGQRLASANCAFAGARGLFRHHGAHYVRRLLSGDEITL